MHGSMLCLWISVAFIAQVSYSCVIWGSDTGECSLQPLDKIWRESNIPFCKDVVTYPACLPKFQPLPESREYPRGRWFNHTPLTKDTWVHQTAIAHIQYRQKLENNDTLRARGVNEHGDPVVIRKRFYHHPDCKNAYKNYFCWVNFPRCDLKRDESLAMCRSSCENYFISCGLDHDIWRCGKSQYFNGYEPEEPEYDFDGNAIYLRDYFPGQPFRENKFNLENEPIPICTPSLLGAASRVGDARVGFLLALLVGLGLVLL